MLAATRRLVVPAVLALSLFSTVVLGLASCCVNSTSGVDFADDCVCLVDNTQFSGQVLRAGETRLYHWVLDMNNSGLVSGSVRGNLTFEMTPCNGSASIDIKSGSPSSWQNLPHFNSSDDYNPAIVTIPAKFTEQMCFVTAGDVDTAFDIAVHTTLYDRPTPGNGGQLSAEMRTSGIARVLVNTTENEGADDVMYSLYWSRLPETDEGACTLASDNTSLRENPNCLFWSACGIGNAADGHTDWVTLEANTGHVFEVAVDDDSSYLFNVAMVDSRNITSVYSGTNVSFTSTDYQDCVADPDCTSQLNEDSTIIAIAAAAVTALALLIAGMTLLHKSIANIMRETVTSRNKLYASGTRALFGDKRSKANGTVHIDDSTPMASPAQPYKGGSSSPFKEKRQEQEEESADSRWLAGQPEKPPNRRSPKRSSVGSSRPPKSSGRPDDETSGREEDDSSDAGGAGGRKRSVAPSPRARKKRGGGSRRAEKDSDEDQDHFRSAPRSDLDNNGRVDSEGKQWRMPVSGRSSLSGGTRTHKSPPASPSSRREPARGRGASPKASRKSYDDDGSGDGGDNEGGRGAGARGRATGGKGGWEQQVARSSAMQSKPRRRNPKGYERRDTDEEDEG
ncbi:unnamed protein product [Ectocarpus sp. 13 AM-2016]